ncbi:MAG TPA: HAMP domain-containing sensor histidine kinase, partial [Rhizomicrobium sp.]
MEASREPLPWRLVRSFSLKLLLLAVILLAVPLILYWQFQRAERQEFALLQNAAQRSGRIIAAMLRPRFAGFRHEIHGELREALAGAAIDNTKVKVLVRPEGADKDDFIYIASAPPLPAEYLKQETRDLVRSGIFQRLAPTCDKAAELDVRFVNPAGKQEVITSMTPVHIDRNCWIVVTAQSTAMLTPSPLNNSFWTIPAMQAAAAIYVLSAALVIWLFLHLWRNVARFRAAAHQIRMHGAGAASFRERNTIPELARVTEDFDSLVAALTASQAFIKQAAEENAHALKAPLGVIAQALEPLKRAAAPSDTTAQRSLQLMERSIARLDTLVSAMRDVEQAAAEAVYPMRRLVNLSRFLAQLLGGYEATLAAQGKHLAVSLEKHVSALANEDVLEPVIENILENAAGFTAQGGTIEVTLERHGALARIVVADRGPGIEPARLVHIFDRYVSYRSDAATDVA